MINLIFPDHNLESEPGGKGARRWNSFTLVPLTVLGIFKFFTMDEQDACIQRNFNFASSKIFRE